LSCNRSNNAQTAGGAALLELRIDAKSYRSADGTAVEVVRGLNLRLETGSFGALIGPSGCGKTTILKIAAGLDADFRGERRTPGSGRLGMVFQEPRLLAWRTVEQNIRLALPSERAGIDLTELVEILGLGAHLTRYPGELSLGLARRVAVARAFAVDPDFLLLDEPFVSLDEATADRLRNELLALTTRTEVTTLFVTHDLSEAVQLADRLFFLSDRPTRIILEKELPPPRSTRGKDAVASISDEMRALLAQATAGGN
jgi:ABC-type nitrate/sulfonate/bicarbonate transport system ATPase subunit